LLRLIQYPFASFNVFLCFRLVVRPPLTRTIVKFQYKYYNTPSNLLIFFSILPSTSFIDFRLLICRLLLFARRCRNLCDRCNTLPFLVSLNRFAVALCVRCFFIESCNNVKDYYSMSYLKNQKVKYCHFFRAITARTTRPSTRGSFDTFTSPS
jgi:hypothetical protein